MKKRRVAPRRQQWVRDRAQSCCEYCTSQEAYSPDSFSTEHIIPEALGGDSTEDNLAYACQGCNNRKYIQVAALDPITMRETPLFHPRRDVWAEHFAWNRDFTELIGLTPTGRSTVTELRLNRENVVNLRRVLTLAGKHPPAHCGT